MTRYAIMLSAEEYVNFPRTPFCHADAALLYATLTGECDYAVQHSLHLKLDRNTEETPEKILTRIKDVVAGSVAGDTILFYFAGHGHKTEDDRAYLILPHTVPENYDKTALSLEQISDSLRLRDRFCFRVFDACHSGVDVRDGAITLDASGFVRVITHDVAGWVTLAACRDDQYSIGDPSIGQGVFTYYFCNYIRNVKPNNDIFPEILKVEIADKVFEHAKTLGNRQNPTLNASISGNITLATRRIEIAEKSTDGNETEGSALEERIKKLQRIPDIIAPDFLRNVRERLVGAVHKEFESRNSLDVGISVGSPLLASSIPDEMHKDVVTFAQRQGLHSRHELRRTEEEVDESQFPWTTSAVLSAFYPTKKRKHVYYDVSQSDTMPESATVVELTGDERCIPNIKILVYVIPLQLNICLLVSAFQQGWPPNNDALELLCHSYQWLKPGQPPEGADRLASFAVERIQKDFKQRVERRLNELEKELAVKA